MRHDQHQVFTVFGGFVPEHRGHVQEQKASKPVGPLAAVFAALLLGSVTAAGAITAIKRTPGANYSFMANPYSKISGVAFLEDALY